MISVIMPIYNSENSLNKSINSILKQTYDNLELILINDGSKDNSLEICREYEKKDSRVSVFTQENQGPSSARNKGLANAKGTYIAFIDSDDYIEKNTYEYMKNEIVGTDSDMVICGYRYEKNGKFHTGDVGIPDGIYEEDDCRKILLDFIYAPVGEKILPFTGLRLLRRDIIESNNFRFNENIRRTEDYLFLIDIHMKVKRISSINSNIFYTYLDNSDSITRTYLSNYYNMVLEIYEIILGKASVFEDEEYVNRIEWFLIYRTQMAILNVAYKETSMLNKIKEIKGILDHPTYQKNIKDIDISEGVKNLGVGFRFMYYRMPIIYLLYGYYKKYQKNK